ncbi:MAG: TetR/AcrR family transcriptional regulator [bacterium]|nr:TetR/AcrR family transcriptional regulator [bacterium]
MTTRDSDGRGAAPAEPTRRVRGRPRSDEIEGTILKVAGELLAEGGFAALNFDALAARARCSKATIYRRWTSKGHLAVATLAELPDPALPDRGDLREDLRELLGGVIAIFNQSSAIPVMQSLIGERARDPELADLLNLAFQAKREGLANVLRRGVARGELPAETDLEFLMDLIVGPILCRYLCTGAPVVEEFVDEIVEAALTSFALRPS